MSARFYANRWILYTGTTILVYGCAWIHFYTLKILLWTLVLTCLFTLVRRNIFSYRFFSLLIIVAVFICCTMFAPTSPHLPGSPDGMSPAFWHRCKVAFFPHAAIFNSLESGIFRFVGSFVQHAWPDTCVLYVAFPIAVALIITGNKIFHLLMTIVPNRYFEFFGYISGQCAYEFPPLLLLVLLRAGVNSFLWWLAMHLLALPHAAEFAVLMGLAAFIPFWGIWIGGIIPIFIYLQSPLPWVNFIGLVISLAVIRLINYLMHAFATEPNWTIWDPYLCLFLIILGFIIFGWVGLFSMAISYYFITSFHTFLIQGSDLIHEKFDQQSDF